MAAPWGCSVCVASYRAITQILPIDIFSVTDLDQFDSVFGMKCENNSPITRDPEFSTEILFLSIEKCSYFWRS